MKAIKKLLYFLAVAGTTMFASSCTDDLEYTPAGQPSGQQVYFAVDLAETINLEENSSSVTIPVSRVVTDEAASFSIFATEESGLFTIPSTVDFAAGESTANLVITYTYSALTQDQTYSCTLTIGDTENTSPYGMSSYEFSLIAPSPWTSLGMGTLTDDVITGAFSVENQVFTVEIQESDNTPGMYRVVDPYKDNRYSLSADGTGSSSNYSCYLVIDATDPEAVTISKQNMGILSTDLGDFQMESTAPGTLDNGIITFPKGGIELSFTGYQGAFQANKNGLFKVVLPGASDVAAPAVTVAYKGSFIDAASNKSNAVLDFTLNETATSYKFAVVEGNIAKNEAALTETAGKIVDGSLESTEGTASGSVLYPLAVSGTFTVVAVPFNAEGDAGAAAATAFIYSADGAPDIVQVQTGNYTVHVTDAKDGYDCPLTLTAGDGFNEFVLDGLFGFTDYAFIGEYDPTTLTITFDGTVLGMEDMGPRWGYGIAYVDETQSEIYTILSNEADDPCVISVNEDGTLKAFTTSLQLIGFVPDSDITRMYEQIEANTPISKGAESGTSARIAGRKAQLSTALRANF
ncbi:hypothetical protein [uncultured Alistipes sp.]|uniref:hypothetical protein n=1 Tax=uncultured Alistipes sp. TaxID=538949 RepID=UPI00280516C9|nr:hypothetical protein [uncultured Alistipes sp.]